MTAADDVGPNGPVRHLGPEWELGPDGVRFRQAARVLLVDDRDRVLLVHGSDVDQRERTWWFTVGGGLEPGEDPRDGAVRELFEETGIALDPGVLLGPVFRRSALFDFFRETCRQDELFYLARYPTAGDGQALSRAGWTDIEHDTIDELRWWDLDALAVVDEEVFPIGLPQLVRGLLAGWDGVTRTLGD